MTTVPAEAVVCAAPSALAEAVVAHLEAAGHVVTVTAFDVDTPDLGASVEAVVVIPPAADDDDTGAIERAGATIAGAAAQLAAGGGGRLVAVGSATGLVGAADGAALDATALIGPIRRATTAWAAAGVAANVVAAGALSDEGTTHADDPAAATEHDDASSTSRAARRPLGGRGASARGASLLGRRVTVGEVATVVAFLCTADAAFVNGAVVPVDGGATMGFL